MSYRIRLSVGAALLFAAACNRAPQTKEAVRQAVVEHVSKNAGLNVNSMDIEVTAVSFQGKQASATVWFRPKGSPDAGMQMNYTLEANGSKWVVQKKAGGGPPPGHPPTAGGAEGLPEGHPPVNPSGR